MNEGLAKHHVRTSLHKLAGNLLGGEWRVLARILEQWNMIVGESLARHACPVAIKPIRSVAGEDRARLIVRIPGALAPQFQMQEMVMKERINRLMGYAFIEKIVFEHKIG